ncbi:MAG TPA: NAD-dependent epimerase/dehydratase family protein [Thermoanaerobaculia bacterium]|nr:NAD-dependent epimerase/dehydratase family protein [Thermoanaerobaculia bacterium]
MATILVTGSAGLIGSQSVHFFARQGHRVVGIDNDMRSFFFGDSASTSWNAALLKEKYKDHYVHFHTDVRDRDAIARIFEQYESSLALVIHAAAQPSHDWAATNPEVDFTVNANGTLALLEATRRYRPDIPFIFTSTNKVYGDQPNHLPLLETETRWEIDSSHPYVNGIDETMSIDQSKHSLFGVSKVAADLMVQEYGRYFGMKTVVFRGGCLTGPAHSAAKLHGFLAYLMKCCISGEPYTIFGYRGKQVRDNIHSVDLVSAFDHFFRSPRAGGEVYNIGGSRHSNCSVLEAIALCEEISGRTMNYDYDDNNRSGDHIWYISDVAKFRRHFPDWEFKYDLRQILEDIYRGQIAGTRV